MIEEARLNAARFFYWQLHENFKLHVANKIKILNQIIVLGQQVGTKIAQLHENCRLHVDHNFMEIIKYAYK